MLNLHETQHVYNVQYVHNVSLRALASIEADLALRSSYTLRTVGVGSYYDFQHSTKLESINLDRHQDISPVEIGRTYAADVSYRLLKRKKHIIIGHIKILKDGIYAKRSWR